MRVSPTAEGFRAAFRRPLLTLGEITWRWTVGATATTMFFFGLFEYLNTLPVSRREMLFLRTRHPYLVAQAIGHILRGSLPSAVISAIVAVVMLAVIWILAASLGRIATVRALLDYFRDKFEGGNLAVGAATDDTDDISAEDSEGRPWRAMVHLNTLRAAVALSALIGFAGAIILAGFASSPLHPRPGLVFLLLVPLTGIICLVWWGLNWLLSLASVFAVRDGEDALGAISAAVSFVRTRLGPVMAVSTWTGLAHLVVFVGATTVIGMPLSVAGLLPWRLVLLGILVLTLAYLVVADWLYMARLAGYVCVAEIPEALLHPPLPSPRPVTPPAVVTTIDRDELILSDIPNLAVET
jgi:hypothetical protein